MSPFDTTNEHISGVPTIAGEGHDSTVVVVVWIVSDIALLTELAICIESPSYIA